MKLFLVFILTQNSLATTSYSWFFFLLVCKLRKSLQFGSVKIHNHCLYWKAFCTNVHRKAFFSSLLLFSYISWSLNCKSWVSKFHHLFLGCLETKARFIFKGFKYCPLSKVHFQLSSTFFSFFHLFCKLFKGRFGLLFQPVNCMSWVIESCNISWRCLEA